MNTMYDIEDIGGKKSLKVKYKEKQNFFLED
jgi:hypothetical protein